MIRYTTNGAVPTAASALYSAPLTINTTVQLRSRVFQTGLLPGETETAGYLLLDSTTSGFSSSMPLVVITNYGLGQPPDLTDQSSFMWVWQPGADGKAKFTNLPDLAVRTVMDPGVAPVR